MNLICPWCGAQEGNVLDLEWTGPLDVKSLTCGRCREKFIASMRISVRFEALRTR